MQTQDYFQSITDELNVLKNRVRNFIGSKHWQTDGEWKESVLRAILRRHLPTSIRLGRGFVIGDAWALQQIDILLFSSESPVLYQDGDLVFISADAVLGVVEVKTAADRSIDEDAMKLATMSEEMSAHTIDLSFRSLTLKSIRWEISNSKRKLTLRS
jgi:hypothetical protein